MKICVLIPAYNESERIGNLVSKILTLEEIEEVVVVDDGSSDSTYEEAKKAGATVLKHERNRGKGVALRTGFSYVKGKNLNAVITMDGDGQHDWHEIPHFIEAFQKDGTDIVLGSRMPACRVSAGRQKCEPVRRSPWGVGGDMPLIRYLTNRFTSFVTSLLCGCKITDSQSGFRLISIDVLKKIELSSSNFEIESEVIIKAGRKGYKIKEMPISTVYLADSTQKSKIHPLIDTLRFFRLVIRNL